MSWRLEIQKVTFSMSKRKACYDVSYKLKAVKCAEDKSKEAAARMFKVIHVGFASGASRRRNCMFPAPLGQVALLPELESMWPCIYGVL